MQDDGDRSVERLRRQQAALARFGLHAFRGGDLDELLHRAAELVSEGLDVKFVKVLELLPSGRELLIRAGVNWRPGVVGEAIFGADEGSPGGHALARGKPVISPDVATETRFSIPKVLIEHGVRSMVNVVIAGKDGPFGVLEVDAPRRRDFDEDDIAFLSNYANLLAAAIDRHRAHHDLEAADREQKVLIRELAHRVKNMLGLVQSLAKQTTAEEPAARAFRETFVGRLQALARAENLVFEDHAQEVDLAQLAPRALEPFERDRRDGIEIDGPALRLPARSGRILGLVLHELATNATKHGALSTSEGRVRLSWRVEATVGGPQVRLRWKEEGGPAVAAPARRGFGTRLLGTLAGYELDGQATLDHAPDGVVYELVFTGAGE